MRTGKKWSKLPPGWTSESVESFWNSLTDRAPKHPVSRCIREMDGKVSDPGAFCGGLADEMTPGWRSEKKAREGQSPLSLRRDYGDQLPGGLADKKKPSDFDEKALEEGVKVEMEHTTDADLAREIAMDHLTEDPNYYSKLKTIEKHAMSRRVASRYRPLR